MDTGLYYGIRMFEHSHVSDKPELSSNRDECREYIHNEYVVVNSNSLLPFGVMLVGEGYSITPSSMALFLVCGEEKIEVAPEPTDWLISTYNGNTYVNFIAQNPVHTEQNIGVGIYHLELDINVGTGMKFYSDLFYLSSFVEGEVIPNYTITFEVIGGNGTLTASILGVSIQSGTVRWGGVRVDFLATPNEGYWIKEWTRNGVVVLGQESSATYAQFLNEDLHVTVEFKQVVYNENYLDTYLKET